MTNEPNAFYPTTLKNEADALVIEWSDGVHQRIRWRVLRDNCPCATCRSKKTEPQSLLPVLDIAEAQPIGPTSMKPIGNYAYGIAFNDGHDTGIFTVDSLRELGDAANATD